VFPYVVAGAECDFYVSVFEQFCNEGCLLASVRECAPLFVIGCGVLCLWHRVG
jgi:hypothetical protein